jgi:acyl-CoA synthetase (AMP-forming)/AMP-acid ligase II/acyl carrier protein
MNQNIVQTASKSLELEASKSNLVNVFLNTVANYSDHGIRYLSTTNSHVFQSYSELMYAAQCMLTGLRRSGLRPGDIVLFQLDRLQDFIVSFWACVFCGAIPVPLSIPGQYSPENVNVRKLFNAYEFLGSPAILTTAALKKQIAMLGPFFGDTAKQIITVDNLSQGIPCLDMHVPEPDDVALMLLTSGSTGVPKVVMQTHRAIISRSDSSAQCNNFSADDISLNWFPLDHVGGIIMFHIRDIYLGATQIHAPTNDILQNPLLWLECIQEHRVTITWAPNFAFGLINSLAEKVNEREWELSSLRFILNAGEAIVARTARAFMQLLIPHGLPETAMHPAWGMSETSSAITYSHRFRLDTTVDDTPFVEVGEPIPGISMRIVNHHGDIVPDETIGLLQVQGPTVTCGYYQNPETNSEVFTEDGWFVTGDMGFIRNGALTITGRKKDVIIVNGIVHYPHELEALMEQVEGVEPSYSAVVGIRKPGKDTDTIIAFFNTSHAIDEQMLTFLNQIRGNVAKNAGVSIEHLIPLEKGAIPKTEIGKIQRAKLRGAYQKGSFDAILEQLRIVRLRRDTTQRHHVSRARTAKESAIYKVWVKILELDDITLDDSFFEIGGTSLTGIQLISELESVLGTKLSPLWLFEHPTIRAMSSSDGPDCTIDARSNRGKLRRQRRLRAIAKN